MAPTTNDDAETSLRAKYRMWIPCDSAQPPTITKKNLELENLEFAAVVIVFASKPGSNTAAKLEVDPPASTNRLQNLSIHPTLHRPACTDTPVLCFELQFVGSRDFTVPNVCVVRAHASKQRHD